MRAKPGEVVLAEGRPGDEEKAVAGKTRRRQIALDNDLKPILSPRQREFSSDV